jgi:uncharacterized membrane protein YjjB (DUF3815 family)
MNDWTLMILTGFVGSFAFAFLFNIRGKKLFFASLGCILALVVYMLLKLVVENTVFCYFIVALLTSVYAELMARILKSPATTFITLSLIPFVPGSALYNTMASSFNGNWELFFENAIYTLSLAIALALGVVLVAAATRMIIRIKRGEIL